MYHTHISRLRWPPFNAEDRKLGEISIKLQICVI